MLLLNTGRHVEFVNIECSLQQQPMLRTAPIFPVMKARAIERADKCVVIRQHKTVFVREGKICTFRGKTMTRFNQKTQKEQCSSKSITSHCISSCLGEAFDKAWGYYNTTVKI